MKTSLITQSGALASRGVSGLIYLPVYISPNLQTEKGF